jgi:hypothetical protein
VRSIHDVYIDRMREQAARRRGDYTCQCDNPQPDAIGECGHCRRLVVTPELTARIRNRRDGAA